MCTYTSLASFQTRSGAEFSSWGGPHVTATDPAFDFQELLKKSVERSQAAEHDHSGLFSLSPLTSPESSRASSLAPLSPTALDKPLTPPPARMTPESPISHPVDRTKKKKKHSHACRNKKRAKEKEARFSPYGARPTVQAKYVDHATSVHTSASVKTSRVARTAYTALDDRIRSKRLYSLHELVDPESKLGLTLQEWDGVLSLYFFFLDLLLNTQSRGCRDSQRVR